MRKNDVLGVLILGLFLLGYCLLMVPLMGPQERHPEHFNNSAHALNEGQSAQAFDAVESE